MKITHRIVLYVIMSSLLVRDYSNERETERERDSVIGANEPIT
jgi:hypothetical protein